MSQFNSLSAYKIQTQLSLKKRARYALKVRSVSCAMRVANDFLKLHFAKYMVADMSGTVQFEWTMRAAFAWLPFCSPDYAMIFDTYKLSIVSDRSHAYN